MRFDGRYAAYKLVERLARGLALLPPAPDEVGVASEAEQHSSIEDQDVVACSEMMGSIL
jgi:hypothetical protein